MTPITLQAQETRGVAATALEREDMHSIMTIFEELENIALKELQRDILPRFLTSKLLKEYDGSTPSVSPSPPTEAVPAASRPSILSAIGSAVAAATTGGTRERRRSHSLVHTGSRPSGKPRAGSSASATVTPPQPPASPRDTVATAMSSGWGVGGGSSPATTPACPPEGTATGAAAEAVLALGSKLNRKTRVFGFGFKMHSSDDKRAFKEVGEYLGAHAIKAGYVYKRGDKNPTWKRRWVVLAPAIMGYFESASDTVPKGVVNLRELTDIRPDVAGELDGLPFTFSLVSPARNFYMQASSERDLGRWLQALTEQWQAALAAPTDA